LLSNVMLDDHDWELDRRGHRFVRFADDGRIYVQSRRARERVMQSITQYVEQRLKLRVNRGKSVVDLATRRPLLGFTFFRWDGEIKVGVDPKRIKRAKDRLRELTSRRWGVSMERRITEINRFTVGWTRISRSRTRRIRSNGSTSGSAGDCGRSCGSSGGATELGGATSELWGSQPSRPAKGAGTGKGYWRIAGSPVLNTALPNAYWVNLGLQGFSDPYRGFRDAKRTARCGPARRVVWGAPG
jgi:RNA-directed DNA polymerase